MKYKTVEEFAQFLIGCDIIDHNAWYDSDDWDGGCQRSGVEYLYISLKNDFDHLEHKLNVYIACSK